MKNLLGVLLVLSAGCSPGRYYYFKQPQDFPARPESRPVERSIPIANAPRDSQKSYAAAAGVATPMETSRASRPATEVMQERVTPINKESPRPAKEDPKKPKSNKGDLYRSFIFVIAGIGALIIGGEIFTVLGTLSVMIGIIFGIKWFFRR